MMSRLRLKYLIRVLLGLIFVFSATAKLVGIDSFEIYLFNSSLMSLGTAFFLARAVIVIEYIAAILLITNVRSFLAYSVSGIFLTACLCWMLFVSRGEDCHCFGDLVQLPYRFSLSKTLAMTAALAFTWNLDSFKPKHRSLIVALAFLVPAAAVFAITPPDNWRYGSYAEEGAFDAAALDAAVEAGPLPRDILEGNQIVCFYSVKCEYCRLSTSKLAGLRSRGDLAGGFAAAPVTAVFGLKDGPIDTVSVAAAVSDFFEGGSLVPDRTCFISADEFLGITRGSFPLILFLSDGKPQEIFHYRDLH